MDAITEAVERRRAMRLIDADALKIPSEEMIAKMIIDSAPSIDIVRCKECKHYDKFPTWSACTYWSGDPFTRLMTTIKSKMPLPWPTVLPHL